MVRPRLYCCLLKHEKELRMQRDFCTDNGNHSAGKHNRGFCTFHIIIPPFTIYPHLLFTIYPHLLLTPIYYLPSFTIYPHLLFTPIYYLPPFTNFPHLLLYPFIILRYS